MDCKVAQELISLHVDGTLDGDDARHLEAHMESCSECRQRLVKMKSVMEMVHNLNEEELPDGFSDRLRLRLEAEQVSRMAHRKQSKFSRCIRWVGIAAAAAVIVLAIRVLGLGELWYMAPQEQRGQTDSAAPEDMSRNSLEGSQAEESAYLSDSPAAEDDMEKQIPDKGDVRVAAEKDGKSEQSEESDGYIKSDKVELRVQDVCITPQTIMVRAIEHGIDVVDQSEDSITLKVRSIDQRKALYRELKLLGAVEEVGTNFESDRVSIVIVKKE